MRSRKSPLITRLKKLRRKKEIIEFLEYQGELHPLFWIFLILLFLYGIAFLARKLF